MNGIPKKGVVMEGDISDEKMAKSPFGYYARKKLGLIKNGASSFWHKKDCIDYFVQAFYAGDREKVLYALNFISIPFIVKAVIEDNCEKLMDSLNKGKAEDLYDINSTFRGHNFSECLIHTAARFNSIHCLKEILEQIDDVNVRMNYFDNGYNHSGPNALELAVSYQRYKCVRLLLNHGVLPQMEDICSELGMNAYELAREKEDLKMLDIMNEYTALPINKPLIPYIT